MQKQLQILKALSDSTRMRIVLLLLNNGELCVCDIMESLGIPQSTASRHLSLLRSAGLVDGERRGVWMHYRIAEEEGFGRSLLTALHNHCANLAPVVDDHRRCADHLKNKNEGACN